MSKINFRPLFYSAVMFMIALVFARQVFSLSIIHILFVVLGFSFLFYICYKNKCLKRFFILTAVFCIGIAYFFAGYYFFLGKDYKESVFVYGRVSSIYENTGYKSITLDDIEINGDKKSFNISLCFSGDIKIELGNKVMFETMLQKVELFTKSGYNGYFYKNNTPYKCNNNGENFVVKEGYLKLDEKIRKSFTDFLNKYLDKDMSGLITTVMFGDKSTLDFKIDDAYSLSGMAHLLAVSGMHIVLIVSLLSFCLKKMHINKYVSFSIIFISLTFFTYLCSFAPSIVRALIMSLIFSLSTLFGKKYDKLNSLGLCAFLILLFKPLYIFDAGFLLSFGCVFCIFVLTKPITNLLLKTKMNKKFALSLGLVSSVQLGLLPLLSAFNNNFNIFSLPINMICVPFFEFAFMVTFIVVPFCAIMPFLSFILTFLAHMYSLVTIFANFVGGLSWANMPLLVFNDILICISYFVMFLCSKYVNIDIRKKSIASCLILAVGFFATFLIGII